jgi:small ligand-binding sensory domain FIST
MPVSSDSGSAALPPAEEMQFWSAAAQHAEPEGLIEQIVAQARQFDQPVDLALVFFSAPLTAHAAELTMALQDTLAPRLLLGCSAEGVVTADREIESDAAVTLAAARLPGAQITAFALQPDEWHKLLLDEQAFRSQVGAPADPRLFLLFGDPFSTPMDDVLEAFNHYYPGVPAVGGMASGALRPHGNLLVLNRQTREQGLVGAVVSGELDIDIIVSQGCRPIWRPFKVDRAHRNILFQLEGKPPLIWIQELIQELSEEERALLQNGLFVGRALPGGADDQAPAAPGRGDFLIRGVTGVDYQNGAIAVGDIIGEGETIQFHVRDAVTAQEDLEMLLIPQFFRQPAAGGFLFLCNGRGTRLYDRPNMDISIIQKNLGELPLAGFFCAGEVGPVGAHNYLHGHTASLVLFRPARPPD